MECDEDLDEHRNFENVMLTSSDLLEQYEQNQNTNNHESLLLNYFKEISSVNSTIERQSIPEFIKDMQWLNVSRSLNLSDFRNRITVVDFFTYCCINCLHNMPVMHRLHEKSSTDNQSSSLFSVISVHSAKFSNEKALPNLIDAIKRYKIENAVLNDADMQVWNYMNITCWPTVLIIGPDLKILLCIVGEGHEKFLNFCVSVAIDFYKNSIASPLTNLPIKLYNLIEGNYLSYPGKIFVDDDSSIFISDSGNNRIVIVNSSGHIELCIGSGKNEFIDGNFQRSSFSNPQGLVKINNLLFVADAGNNRVRKIDLHTNLVTTLNMMNVDSFPHKNISPWDIIASKTNDYLIIALAGVHQLWAYSLVDCQILKENVKRDEWLHLCGNGVEGAKNNLYPKSATLAQPSGLTLFDDIVVFADSESSSVRCFSLLNGSVKNIVGGDLDPTNLFSYDDVDGVGQMAKLQHPMGLTTWIKENGEKLILVADTFNNKIKSIDIKTRNCTEFLSDGLNEPSSLFLKHDNLYIADTNNCCIKILHLNSRQMETLKLNDKLLKIEDNLIMPKDTHTVLLGMQNISKECQLRLNISLKNYSLNYDAPNKWCYTIKRTGSNDLNIRKSNKILNLDSTIIDLNTLSYNLHDVLDFNFQLVIYLCYKAQCLVKGIIFHGQLTIKENGMDNLFLKYDF